MSIFTFFSALERISDNDSNKKENKRIVIPDYLIKLFLQNKTKLLKDKYNNKSIKELFVNRNINNYMERNIPNYAQGYQKYKSLEKNNLYSENNKYNSQFPKIGEKILYLI